MSSVKKISICAICTALCTVLPPVFHMVGLGSVFSPMHIPVLLCGLVCGWPYPAYLIHMAPELCVYGLVCGLLMAVVHTGRPYADLYCALIPAMLLGRVAGGAVRAAVFAAGAQPYSLALWAGSYLVEAVPGIILHLALVPALVLVLTRTGLIPRRYPQGKALA